MDPHFIKKESDNEYNSIPLHYVDSIFQRSKRLGKFYLVCDFSR
jgi:hypothetical protein